MTATHASPNDTIGISRAVAERIVNSLVAVGLTARVEDQGSSLRVDPEVRDEFDALVELLQSRLREASIARSRSASSAKGRGRLRLVSASAGRAS